MKTYEKNHNFNSSKTIAIRCLTLQEKGFGHFSRSLLIAEELKIKKFNIHFIIDSNPIIKKILRTKKIPFTTIHSNLVNNTSNLYHKLKTINFDLIILDMREFGEKISKFLVSKGLRVILFDDAWINNVYADIVFNGTIADTYHKYKIKNPTNKLFVGPRYWISNKYFTQNKKPISHIKKKSVYTIVISLGGNDSKNSSFKIANILKNISNLKIHVIIGPFFKNINNLKKLSLENKNIKLKFSPKNIWNEFYKADLVISGSGNTLHELAIQRIPTLCLAMSKHQILFAKYFSTKGFGFYLGESNKINKIFYKNSVENILKDEKKRKNMSQNARKLIDGKGLERTISIMEKFLINPKI